MRRWQWWLGAALLLALALAHFWLYELPFEDSYISFRYARNLASGLGVVYNPGERVEGCTSVGWVFILAGAARLGFSLPVAGLVLSMAFGLALVLLTVFMTRRYLPALGPWALGAGLLLAAHGTLAYYSASAMETSLFALLVSASLTVTATGRRRAALFGGALIGVAALVRPEAMGYFGLFALALGCRGYVNGAPARAEARREIVAFGSAFAAVFLPFLAWRLSYYGQPLPNTYYAKARLGGAGLVTGFEQVEEFLTLGLFWLAPLGLYLLWARERLTRFFWLGLAVVAGAAANVVFIGGDSFVFYRCFLPALPAGAVLSVGGLHELYQRHRERVSPARAVAILGGIAAFVFAGSWIPRTTLISDQESSNREVVVSVDRINADYFQVGRFLRENFPKSTTLATNAAGIVPYESGLWTLDMLGLNDAHIARAEVSGQGGIGHQKHDASYVLSKKPDVILPVLPMLAPKKPGPQELVGFIQSWFSMLPGDRELFDHPGLAEDYLLVTLPVRDKGWLTLYVRKGVPMPGGLTP